MLTKSKWMAVIGSTLLPCLAACPLTSATPASSGTGFYTANIVTAGSHVKGEAGYDNYNVFLDLDGFEIWSYCTSGGGFNKHQFTVTSDWEYLYESYPKTSYYEAAIKVYDTDSSDYAHVVFD